MADDATWLDRSQDWLEDNKLPLGRDVRQGVDWLTTEGQSTFDAIKAFIQTCIDGILWVLETPHPFVIVFVFAAFAYYMRRSVLFTLFVVASLLLIVNLGYWEDTVETLALLIASTIVCMGLGVPIGIAAARKPWLYAAIRPVLDLMQTIPTFVYLIPALILFGLREVPGLIATVVFVIPAPIRAAHLGVSSTPAALKEAGRAFGASHWQLLFKVELPYATPQIMAGLTQTIMLSLSMVVIAGLVGAGGLGAETVRALTQSNIAKGFEVGLCIVLIAIIFDRMFRRPEKAA